MRIFFCEEDTIENVQRKYKTEIGESMVQPSEKLKKILFIIGVAGAVYVCFQYLLPLVIPFLLAYAVALALHPSASWVARRCRVTVGKRQFGISIGVAGAVEFLILFCVLAAGIYVGGQKLLSEAGMLIDQIPLWVDQLDIWLTAICHRMETWLCLKENFMVVLMRDMLKSLVDSVKNTAMPYLMVNSMGIFSFFIQLTVIWVVLTIGVMLSLQEMAAWKERARRSIFKQEFTMIGRRLRVVANAYIKTQGVIMLLTTAICTVGFGLMGNPYYILAGIGIGLLDALPIFGTGTVLIPWAIITFFQGNVGKGLVLLGLYVICYFLREILEAKMMGDKVGLSPLETLISMYVGLQLFGILGFVLGPVGLVLIEDIVGAAEEDR